MKTNNGLVSVIVLTFFILTIALPLNVDAGEIRIDSIGDSHIGKEVTVSGIITAISSNIEPSKEVDVGIQTFEPGNTGVITIDDGTDSIFVSCAPQLLEDFYTGQRVMVTGIYAGKDLIYADIVNTDVTLGYTDVTVKDLYEYSEYFYAHSVRIQGTVTRIEITPGVTELEIDDGTSTETMDVEYRAGLENITIGDEVIVEGKFYRNKIYAFSVGLPTPEPTPTPSSTPTPSPTPAPTATPAPTSTPSPVPVEEEGMPVYLIVIVIAIVAVVGVVLFVKGREWLMLRKYGK